MSPVVLVVMKFVSKHKTVLLLLLLVWVLGMVFTVSFLGWHGRAKSGPHGVRTFPQVQNKLPPRESFKMAKVSRYCNHPGNDANFIQEGQVSQNYSLRMVSILFRHGDRAPLQPVHNLSFVLCDMESSHAILDQYLNTVEDFYQSGQQFDSPFADFAFAPPRTCQLAHMTLKGTLQHLLLGSYLKKAYVQAWRLLTNEWTDADILVYSTVTPRTFQSALAFLFGFLPSFDFNKLNITPSNSVTFCGKDRFCKCPRIRMLSSALSTKRIELLKSHPAVLRLLQHLQPILMPESRDYKQPRAILDSFMFYACHGSHLPCVARTHICASFDHVRNILAYVEWEGRQRVDSQLYIKFAWLKVYGLLVELHGNMVNFIDGKRVHKLVVFSGHDVTLEPLLTVLGLGDGSTPPYASRLVFELYATVGGHHLQEHFFLRILYNGKDVTRFVSFCKSRKQKVVLCPFEKFSGFIQNTFREIMGVPTFEAACLMSSQKTVKIVNNNLD